jgi:hypothetical protein
MTIQRKWRIGVIIPLAPLPVSCVVIGFRTGSKDTTAWVIDGPAAHDQHCLDRDALRMSGMVLAPDTQFASVLPMNTFGRAVAALAIRML